MSVWAAARGALTATASSARLVWADRDLRRVQLALLGSAVGDGMYATALAVYTYRWGGPGALGAYLALKLALKASAVPFLVALAGRSGQRTVLVALDATRGALVTAMALVALADGPALAVLALATAVGLVGAPFRPVSAALTTRLAATPRALTAANGAGSTVESVAFFAGPALGGLLLAVSSVPVVFLVDVATFAWSAGLLLRLSHAGGPHRVPGLPRSVGRSRQPPGPGLVREAAVGFRAVAADGRLRLVVGLGCLHGVLVGASAVLTVVVALRLVDLGEAGVGYLGALLGVGSVAGGLVALGRAGRHRAATDLGAGLLLWSLPLVVLGLLGEPVVAAGVFLLLGIGGPLVDVGVLTLLQRLARGPALGHVLGALESATFAALGLGALVTPVLVAALGPGPALVALGAPAAVLALLCRRRLHRLDTALRPPATLGLVQAHPLFAVLPPSTQELLAGRLRRVAVPAGVHVIEAGEVGEEFYLVESGRLGALRGTLLLSEMGPGDGFGEIALLRDVPRTATVLAVEDCVLHALGREDFLAAVGADPESSARADLLVRTRLAR